MSLKINGVERFVLCDPEEDSLAVVLRRMGLTGVKIGCGTGVAAELLCRRLPEGHVTALDRSGAAVGHAERRLARWLDAGIADVVERDLAGFHGDGRPYDVVLAININSNNRYVAYRYDDLPVAPWTQVQLISATNQTITFDSVRLIYSDE